MFFLKNSCSLVCKLTRFLNIQSSRNCSSSLFISGNKASATFSYVSPYLDFDSRFNDLEKLKKELFLRGIKINVDELKETWEFYKRIEKDKNLLEDRRLEVSEKIQNLMNLKEHTQEEQEKLVSLKAQATILKQDLKFIKQSLWEVEDCAVLRALKLPNVIDERTPEETSVILKVVGEPVNILPKNRKHHLDIGNDFGILEYINPLQYYLCNEAALFELTIFTICGEIFGKDFLKIAGSDFSRSLVVEGSGIGHDNPNESFLLSSNADSVKNSLSRLHLVGGASLVSLLSFHTKQVIDARNFPQRYFATGKQYTPLSKNVESMGLFTVCQTPAVQVFSMVQDIDSDEYKLEFDKLIVKATEFYDKLEMHYRIVKRSASELQPGESYKVSFQLWSSFNQEYVEVGFISAYGDFISKRLMIECKNVSEHSFPGIISGTVVSVPRLLACVLEQNPDKLEIPNIIQLYMQRDFPIV